MAEPGQTPIRGGPVSPGVISVTFVLVPTAGREHLRSVADDIQVLSDLARSFFPDSVTVDRVAVSGAWAIRAAPRRYLDLGTFRAFERSFRETAERMAFRCVVEPKLSGTTDDQRAG
jgi:hypothetical protein